jgi:restriction system protein
MPRRGRRRRNTSGELATLIAVVAGIVIGAFALLFRLLSALHRSGAKAPLLENAKAVAHTHIEALSRRRAQLVQSDSYGVPQMDRWFKEIDHFIQHQLMPNLTPDLGRALPYHKSAVIAAIDQEVTAASANTKPFTQFFDNFTPAEFELFCAQVLRENGWDARVTKGSRDQGVDVIAAKGGLRVVIQCKLYTGPVGNKAVQEVSAGRAYENAHFGVVVSNNRYTASAVALAKTNRILLLHHRDLSRLHGILEQWVASPAA